MNRAIDVAAFAPCCAPVPPERFIRLLLRTGFSAEAYRDAYEDLIAQHWDATWALMHFFQRGLQEGRAVPMTLDRQALLRLVRLKLDDADFKARLVASLAAHLFDAVTPPYGPAIAERWPAIQDLVRQGGCAYFIAGDSHSNQFNRSAAKGGRWLLPVHLLCTAGSAAGLGNPASRSGYGTMLRHAVDVIETLPGARAVPFLLQFGQVDIEFVHHFQRVRDGQRTLDLPAYEAFCDQALERYMAFVIQLFGSPARSRVFLVSVFPPVLSDAAWRGGYANGDIVRRETDSSLDELSEGIRRLEIADLRRRTTVHARFNDRLRDACRRHGFGFVDAFTPFLGADGLADPRFASPETGGAEHHLDIRQTPETIDRLIWQCIESCGMNPRG